MNRWREVGLFLLCSILICLAVFHGAFWGSQILAPLYIAPTIFSKYRDIDPSAGNRFLTLLSNMFANLNLTDMETGFKALKREVLERITLEKSTSASSLRSWPRLLNLVSRSTKLLSPIAGALTLKEKSQPARRRRCAEMHRKVQPNRIDQATADGLKSCAEDGR